MLIHRDYSQLKTGVYSMVTVYKDRIEFRNVGNLYGSNTLELLETRKAMEVRNETIVKLLEYPILSIYLLNIRTQVE